MARSPSAAPAADDTTALPTAIKLTASQAGFAPDADGADRYYQFDAGAVVYDPDFIALFVGREVAYEDVSAA